MRRVSPPVPARHPPGGESFSPWNHRRVVPGRLHDQARSGVRRAVGGTGEQRTGRRKPQTLGVAGQTGTPVPLRQGRRLPNGKTATHGGGLPIQKSGPSVLLAEGTQSQPSQLPDVLCSSPENPGINRNYDRLRRFAKPASAPRPPRIMTQVPGSGTAKVSTPEKTRVPVFPGFAEPSVTVAVLVPIVSLER